VSPVILGAMSHACVGMFAAQTHGHGKRGHGTLEVWMVRERDFLPLPFGDVRKGKAKK